MIREPLDPSALPQGLIRVEETSVDDRSTACAIACVLLGSWTQKHGMLPEIWAEVPRLSSHSTFRQGVTRTLMALYCHTLSVVPS